jgi:hypothetical protein
MSSVRLNPCVFLTVYAGSKEFFDILRYAHRDRGCMVVFAKAVWIANIHEEIYSDA